MRLEHNDLLAVGIVAIAATEMVALIMGHNGEFFHVAMGLIAALAGVPVLPKMRRNASTGDSVNS